MPHIDTCKDIWCGTRMDVAYRTAPLNGHEVTLEVDLFLPPNPGAAPRPLLVWFHSGAFCAGTRKRPGHRMLGRRMTAAGMALAVAGYRLGASEADLEAPLRNALPDLVAMRPATVRAELTGPWALAALEDGVALLNWLGAHRDKLGTGGRPVVAGSSAGGMTALNLLHVAPAMQLGVPRIGGAFCFSGAFGYPDLYRPGVAPVFAMHNPNDHQMRIDTIRSLADQDPMVQLKEAPEQEHGAFLSHPGESKRISTGRIIDRMPAMSGLAAGA